MVQTTCAKFQKDFLYSNNDFFSSPSKDSLHPNDRHLLQYSVGST